MRFRPSVVELEVPEEKSPAALHPSGQDDRSWRWVNRPGRAVRNAVVVLVGPQEEEVQEEEEEAQRGCREKEALQEEGALAPSLGVLRFTGGL